MVNYFHMFTKMANQKTSNKTTKTKITSRMLKPNSKDLTKCHHI